MPILTVYSRKGGQGKTSLVLDLAMISGPRCLVLDCDPQSSLSGLLLPGGDSAVCDLDPSQTIAAAFRGETVELIQVRDHLWILPGDHRLKVSTSSALRIPDGFDTVIVDTPPSFSDGIVRACLCKSDYCLVPVTPEPMSIQAAGAAMEMFASCAAATNPSLVHLGIVLTQVRKGVAIHAAIERLLRNMYGSQVLNTTIPQAAIVAEASGFGKSVTEHSAKSQSSKQLAKLVEELSTRLVSRRAA